MKKLFVLSLLMVSMCLLIATGLSADPRMETNNNFCHFILDIDNTDNEIFMAGCNSVITVVEKVVETNSTKMSSVGCTPYIANGYAKVEKVIPQALAPLPPGEELVLTSEMSETPCTMVESNGRAYSSKNWKSTIRVQKINNQRTGQRTINNNNYLTVQYELVCLNGEQ